MRNLHNTEKEVLAYTFIPSAKRKTIGLQVKQGEIIVRAPMFVDKAFVDHFVASKANWLQQKVAEQQASKGQAPRFQIVAGGQLLFLGEARHIEVHAGFTTAVELAEHSLAFKLTQRQLALSSPQLNQLLTKLFDDWLLTQAKHYLPQQLAHWSAETNLSPCDIQIKKYKARWGSCTSRGVLSLNSRLMMCPPEIIDYVIIHELCHLVHLNHSRQFWHLVSSYCPYMTQAKQWLKQHQREFHF
ncbi:M48 family peptidase [Thalassotalea euphylliae]|uniref:M48 family peptidase n=1 Tax=Thalassotalea euphylliae TaxID=1655234 RepID=A0A3E0TN85_9GAMM|nr:SprT family zinc-dependent metalloprotease [Thalassotalea euphylliae]REL25807.1 M48 family peptidase [Thalassotalea euphylliae]